MIDGGMYTYKIAILPPENLDNRQDQTKKIVMELLEHYVNEGRLAIFNALIVLADTWWRSIITLCLLQQTNRNYYKLFLIYKKCLSVLVSLLSSSGGEL